MLARDGWGLLRAVFAGKPQEEEETLAARTALTGERVEDMSGINAKKVWWGMLDEHPQVTARLEAQSEDLLKKKKKVKVAEGKDAAKAGSAPPRERIPLPDLSEEEVQARLQVLAEARQAVRLGPASLPSICMYTFLNTRNKYASRGARVVWPHCPSERSLIAAGLVVQRQQRRLLGRRAAGGDGAERLSGAGVVAVGGQAADDEGRGRARGARTRRAHHARGPLRRRHCGGQQDAHRALRPRVRNGIQPR
jgi:hypothetical protein